MASHSSILAWKIPRTEEPAAWWVAKESDMTYQLNNNRILITNRACLTPLPDLAMLIEHTYQTIRPSICRVIKTQTFILEEV